MTESERVSVDGGIVDECFGKEDEWSDWKMVDRTVRIERGWGFEEGGGLWIAGRGFESDSPKETMIFEARERQESDGFLKI